jgi:hypothetical protein
MGNVSDKVVEEIITHILFSYFFWKSSRLRDNVEEYGKDRQATNDNILGSMCYACRIPKGSYTTSEYVMLTAISRQELLHQIASRFRL